MTVQTLTIGEIARRAGVGVETVRYYERQGLLAEPPRRTSGYRQYPAESLSRLLFIRRAKALGFTLAQVRSLLSLHPGSAQACAKVAAGVREKIGDIDARIRDLRAMRKGLAKLAASCEQPSPLAGCPLLELLGKEEEA